MQIKQTIEEASWKLIAVSCIVVVCVTALLCYWMQRPFRYERSTGTLVGFDKRTGEFYHTQLFKDSSKQTEESEAARKSKADSDARQIAVARTNGIAEGVALEKARVVRESNTEAAKTRAMLPIAPEPPWFNDPIVKPAPQSQTPRQSPDSLWKGLGVLDEPPN